MLSIILFYLASFVISFFLCIPIGPVNLEIFNTAVKKKYAHAFSIAVGASLGDGFWGFIAFLGISPFTSNKYLEAGFLFCTSMITLVLGIIALKDAKKFIEPKGEDEIVKKIKRKRWALLKGLSMVLVNPLGIVSWMICLSFLRKSNIFIPMELRYEIPFLLIISAGAITYFSLIILITRKMKRMFNPARTSKVSKVLGYILIVFSIYFLYYCAKILFFNGSINIPS